MWLQRRQKAHVNIWKTANTPNCSICGSSGNQGQRSKNNYNLFVQNTVRQKNKHITCLPIKLLTLQVFFVLRSKLSTFYEIGLPLRGPVAAFKKLNNSRFSDADPWRDYRMAVYTNRAGDFRSSRSFVLACGGTLSKEFIQMSSWTRKKTLLIPSLREP